MATGELRICARRFDSSRGRERNLRNHGFDGGAALLARPAAPDEVHDDIHDAGQDERIHQEPGPPTVSCDKHLDLRRWSRPIAEAARVPSWPSSRPKGNCGHSDRPTSRAEGLKRHIESASEVRLLPGTLGTTSEGRWSSERRRSQRIGRPLRPTRRVTAGHPAPRTGARSTVQPTAKRQSVDSSARRPRLRPTRTEAARIDMQPS